MGVVRSSGGTRKTRGGHSPPSLRAGRGREWQADHRGRAPEVSHTGSGRAPGRRRPTTCGRPARHTEHRVMSIPVKRGTRSATGFVVSTAERLGRRGSRRWPRREERSTPGQLRRAGPVGQEPEVPDADEAVGEDREEKPVPSPVEGAREELLGQQGQRSPAVPPGVVPPPDTHPALDPERHHTVADAGQRFRMRCGRAAIRGPRGMAGAQGAARTSSTNIRDIRATSRSTPVVRPVVWSYEPVFDDRPIPDPMLG